MSAARAWASTTKSACAARREGADTIVDLDDGTSVRTDVIVLGAERRLRAAGLGLHDLGINVNPHGALVVDQHCRVTDGLWALGDVTGVALLTHVAMYKARVVADPILGNPRRVDYTAIPRAGFAQPEIAAVGLTTAQAHAQGIDLATAELDLPDAIAHPWTYEVHPAGTFGLLAGRRRRTLVGAWAVAPQAGEWIHQAARAICGAIPIDVLLDSVTQYPTFSEAYLAAAEHSPCDAVLAVWTLGRRFHWPKPDAVQAWSDAFAWIPTVSERTSGSVVSALAFDRRRPMNRRCVR